MVPVHAGEDEVLTVGRTAFLVLDLGLDVVDGVGRLHGKGPSLSSCPQGACW